MRSKRSKHYTKYIFLEKHNKLVIGCNLFYHFFCMGPADNIQTFPQIMLDGSPYFKIKNKKDERMRPES